LQFRYRGSRRESAVAQLFSLGHETFSRFFELVWQAEISGCESFGKVRKRVELLDGFGFAASTVGGKFGSWLSERRFLSDIFMQIDDSWPNKSPEPTPVGAYRLPGRFALCYVTGPAWLSFFR
jgi:hypothetical protein